MAKSKLTNLQKRKKLIREIKQIWKKIILVEEENNKFITKIFLKNSKLKFLKSFKSDIEFNLALEEWQLHSLKEKNK